MLQDETRKKGCKWGLDSEVSLKPRRRLGKAVKAVAKPNCTFLKGRSHLSKQKMEIKQMTKDWDRGQGLGSEKTGTKCQ